MTNPWSLKKPTAKVLLVVGIVIWLAAMYYIWKGTGLHDVAGQLGITAAVTYGVITTVVKMIESTNASHTESRGNKTTLYFWDDDEDKPMPS